MRVLDNQVNTIYLVERILLIWFKDTFKRKEQVSSMEIPAIKHTAYRNFGSNNFKMAIFFNQVYVNSGDIVFEHIVGGCSRKARIEAIFPPMIVYTTI